MHASEVRAKQRPSAEFNAVSIDFDIARAAVEFRT
jgi:hypothetical protein